MKLIDRLNLDDAQRQWLALELYRRAASEFELANRYDEAAECLELAGDSAQAMQLLLRHYGRGHAARMLFDRGRYREALDCYREWLRETEGKNVESAVRSRLGIAACLCKLGEERKEIRGNFEQALLTIEKAESSTGYTRGRCWQAVGEYGARTGRWDLVQMGYEKALKSFEGHYSRETGDVVKEYLSAAKNNRLLERRLRERLAEFGQGTKREKPRGAALKVAAERIGEVRRLEGHTDWVSSEGFSPDSRLLASGSADHTVRLWDPETGQEVWKQEINASVVSVDFSPDGRLLAFALGNYAGQELGTDFSIRLWNPETGQEVRRLEGHTDSVSSVRFSPDGRLLASGSHDQTVRLWNPETGLEIRKLHGHGSNVNSVDFSPDGRLLASASGNYSEQKTDDDYTVRLWNLETGLEIRRLLGHRSSVNAISFSPDGRLLVSASGFVPEDPAAPPIGSDDTVRLWNIETGQEVQRLKSHTRYVHKVVFSPDGRFIVSSSGDRTIRIWDLCTKECTAIITRKFHKVGGLALSSDGRYMVSGSSEKYEPQLWDISSLECGA